MVHKSQNPEHDNEYTRYAKCIYYSCVYLIENMGRRSSQFMLRKEPREDRVLRYDALALDDAMCLCV